MLFPVHTLSQRLQLSHLAGPTERQCGAAVRGAGLHCCVRAWSRRGSGRCRSEAQTSGHTAGAAGQALTHSPRRAAEPAGGGAGQRSGGGARVPGRVLGSGRGAGAAAADDAAADRGRLRRPPRLHRAAPAARRQRQRPRRGLRCAPRRSFRRVLSSPACHAFQPAQKAVCCSRWACPECSMRKSCLESCAPCRSGHERPHVRRQQPGADVATALACGG